MFCKVCGRSIQREDNFCSGCGAPIAPEPIESAATSGNSTTGAVAPIAPEAAAVEMHEPLIPAQNQAPPLAAPTVRQFRRCPRCRRINTGTDLSCDWCGTELPADAPAPALDPAANIAPPSFAGYAPSNLTSKTEETDFTGKVAASDLTSKTNRSSGGLRRKSRLPVLEILVIVLLVAGAGAAVWILRSSLPGKTTAAPSSVIVAIVPASARVVAGKAFDFSATVSGTDDAQVIWTVEEGVAGGRVVNRGAKADGGTVSSLGVYIAPRTPGIYHLMATSKADPRESASAEVTVTKR